MADEFWFVPPLPEQPHALILVVQGFPVFEGKVEECPPKRWDILIEALCNGAARCLQCQRIRRKCLGGATKHVPRKLIEQDYVGKAAQRTWRQSARAPATASR